MGKQHFQLKATALAILTSLSCSAYADQPVDLYVQDRDIPYALVKDYLTVTNLAEITDPSDEYSGLFVGVHNRTGNPVRINWYGDMDGKNPQTGAINNGRIYGRLFINALKSDDTYTYGSTELKDYRSSIAPDGQANGIDAYGWVPVSNENDMTFALDKIENTGVVSGFAQLQTGAGTHRSLVVVNASANGVSLYGSGDYGKYIIGADGSEVAIDAGTGGSRSARSVRSANEASVTGVDGVGVIPASLTSDDNNFYGKNIRVALEAVDKQAVALKNTGTIQGQVVVRGNTLSKASADDYAQDYSLTSKASGNGVSLLTQIMTQDRRTYSYDKLTESVLGNVENLGTISGDASLSGIAPVSNSGSSSYTRSYDSGNGISVAARTTRFSKNVTKVAVGNVVNDGHITGKLVQVSGDNTAKRGSAATDLNHVYSQVEAENGGNGIGAFVQVGQSVSSSADENGIHSDGATLTLGNITNRGRITGYAELTAGNGYDFIRMGGIDATGIIGVGNGISASFKAGSVPTATYEIGKVNNSGVISGYLKAVAGQGIQKDNQAVPLEEVKLLVTNNNTFGYFNQPEVLPKSIGDCWGSCDTADAIATIKASGNGLSFFANRLSSTQNGDTYEIGDIFNKGVISGYSEMYHGFQGTNYARVDFLATGVGIATDREFKAAVNNLGIISGNHAALLAKAEISTASSAYNPDYLSGYREPINNYGVMAGTLIAANYQANGSNSNGKYQQYQYFNADKDPVNNLGTLVYFKEGITKAGQYSGAVRNDDAGMISRVVAGAGGEVSIDDGQDNTVKYTVVNGKVTGTDSSYTVADDTLDHYIINGVGASSGAAVVSKDLSLNNSIVNGLVTAVKLQGDGKLTLDNTVINTNGFAVKKSATEFYTPNAILGDDNVNTVILRNGSIVNGDVHLKGGNDKFVIGDESVRINVTDHTLDLGEGEDELVLGENVTAPTATPIVVDYTVAGVERLLVNQPSRIMANKMELPSYMELHNKLVYQAPNNDATSLHGDNREQPVVNLAGKTLKVGIRSPEAYGALEVENANLNVDEAKLVIDSSLLDKATAEKEAWVINDIVSVKSSIYQCGDDAFVGQNCDGYDRNDGIADSYALQGKFASIEDNSALFTFEEYHAGKDKDGNSLEEGNGNNLKALNMRVKRAVSVDEVVNASSPSNDLAVAHGIFNVIDSALVGDNSAIELAKDFGKLSSLAQVRTAFTQSAPVLYANTGNMLIEASRLIADNIPTGFVALDEKDPHRDTHVWGRYIGAWGKTKADSGNYGYLGLSSYKTHHNGFVLGATKYFDKGHIGASVAYLSSKARTTEAVFNEKLTSNTWQAGLYGEWLFTPKMALEGQLGYGHSSLKGTRYQSVLGVSNEGKYHADIAYASLGLRYYMGDDKYRVSPFVRANYHLVKMHSFSEKGGSTRLDVRKQNFDSLLLQAGVDGDFRLGDRWKLGGTLAVGVETLDKKPKLKAGFTVLPGETMPVYGIERPSVIGTAGVRAEFAPTNNSAVTLRYNTHFGKRYIDQQVQLNLRVVF